MAAVGPPEIHSSGRAGAARTPEGVGWSPAGAGSPSGASFLASREGILAAAAVGECCPSEEVLLKAAAAGSRAAAVGCFQERP